MPNAGHRPPRCVMCVLTGLNAVTTGPGVVKGPSGATMH